MTKQERTARFLAGALFLALFFLWGVGYNCFPIFLPSVLKQFHLSRLQVGLVPGVQAITAGVFGLLVGWLLDRVPAQIVMAVGAVSTAVGIVMMSQAGSLNGLLAGSAVTGIGMIASTILPASMVISNWFGRAARHRAGNHAGRDGAGRDGDHDDGGLPHRRLRLALRVTRCWRFR
jgi:fucose permease